MNSSSAGRAPLSTFAIGLGLAGLAAAWTAAGDLLGSPSPIATALWWVTGVVWLSLLVVHTVRGRVAAETLVAQLRHPVQGPAAVVVPVVAMLLGARIHERWPTTGKAVVVVASVVAALFAAWLLARWVRGGLELDAVHGGYLLPTAAAGVVTSASASSVGLDVLARWGFGVGLVFWLVLAPLVVARLLFRPGLPDPLVPTIAILVAPPSVGGLAWWGVNGHRVDAVSQGLAGVTALLVLMQLALLPRYARLRFSLGFWAFTFPLAAVGTYAIHWLALWGGPGWRQGSWATLAVVTGVIGTIAVRSLPRRGGGARGAGRVPEPDLWGGVGHTTRVVGVAGLGGESRGAGRVPERDL